MEYNYDKIVDRSNAASIKWEIRTVEMKKLGIMPLSVADMEIETAPEIIDALSNAAKLGIYGYTKIDDEYKNSIISWFKKRHGWNIKSEDITCHQSIIPAIYTLIRTFSMPGDGIIIQTPVYHLFGIAIKNSGRTVVENKLLLDYEGYKINFTELEKLAQKPENKMMLLCSPHNPIGKVWSREDLIKIADICHANNVILISDEVHFDIVRKQHSVVTAINEKYRENTIVCTSPAKAFNLAALAQANIIIENEYLRKKYEEQQRTEGSRGISYFGRTATITAYTKCEKWIDGLNSYVEENFKTLKNFLNEHYPKIKVHNLEGTYLAWLDLSSLNLDDKALESFLINKALIAANSGYLFGSGGSGFTRLNIAVPRLSLTDALNRFDNALKSLKL